MTAKLRAIDWTLFLSLVILVFFGLITMNTFGLSGSDYFFQRQILWVLVAIAVFFATAFTNWNFLKTNSVFLLIIYFVLVLLLGLLIAVGFAVRGAASWIKVASFNIEPVEIMKPILVLLLAKYFSKRHVEIARFTHLFISAIYAGMPILLVALQPDLGSALVLSVIWVGMSLLSGIRFKHIGALFLFFVCLATISWMFFLYPYQKARIISFLNPGADIRGAGYQAVQSMIAVGSGRIFGKGIGYGTQSRLSFLPEHATDFIFAAFAEEWGLIGVLILLVFFGIVIWRIMRAGIYGESNFEKLYAGGLAILIFFQAVVHVGMNTGLLPITGLGMPFLSYGGSSLVSLFFALGILQSLSLHRKGIFLGGEKRFEEGILGA